jgi:putative nucleotidyltransferase with HDIG domain
VKRLLFVDDEQPALDGLRCRLRRMSNKWCVEGVNSGEGAVEQMQREPYDVIVTDMRMPGMDGAQLLKTVSERWPQTIRIVLSGYADPKLIARLVPFAHQYLSKPCDPTQLEAVIDRCLQLHDLLHGPQLRAIVGRISKLPSLPRVYSALQEAVRDDKITVSEVARLVAADSAIAARVLQLVNSSFFRLARRITNIEQAVSYLGFTAIRNVAASEELFAQWGADGRSLLDPEKLQSHVLAVAAAASALTAKTPIADDTFLAGLLHDIGYWVLAQECPADLKKALDLAAAESVPLHEAETRVMGASHAEVGAYLLGIWGLPYSVIEAVAHHHQPRRVAQTQFDVLAALAIAGSLVPMGHAFAAEVAFTADARIDESYLAAVNAPFDLDEAKRRVAQTAEDGRGMTVNRTQSQGP